MKTTGPPISYLLADGTVDNRAAIQWWIERLFESTHLRYRLSRWWAQVRNQPVPADTAYIYGKIERLARQQVESYF